MPQAAPNPYGHAQSTLKNTGSMLKVMRIAFVAIGALMVLGGVAAILSSGLGAGIGIAIGGVVLAGTGWFTLPKFMSQLGGATAMVDGLAAKEQLKMTGTPMTAQVVSAQQTGAMVNMNPQVLLVLQVHAPHGAYQVQTTSVIPQFNIPQCQPGATINVRVNPQNPQDVAVVF